MSAKSKLICCGNGSPHDSQLRSKLNYLYLKTGKKAIKISTVDRNRNTSTYFDSSV